MALEDIAVEQVYAGDGETTRYDYPHRVAAQDDVIVEMVMANGDRRFADYGRDYTLVDITAINATIVFTNPLAPGVKAIATRNTAPRQPFRFKDERRLDPRKFQDALNRIAMVAQDVKGKADRGFSLPPEEANEAPFMLGALNKRRGRVQAFDDSGRPTYPLATNDVIGLAQARVKLLAIFDKLDEIEEINDALPYISELATRTPEMGVLGNEDAMEILKTIANEIERICFLAEHIQPTFDVVEGLYHDNLLGGLAKAGGLYPDEGPIDTDGLFVRDEGFLQNGRNTTRDEGMVV